MNFIYTIVEFLYVNILVPLYQIFDDFGNEPNFAYTPINITMPGSDTIMLSITPSDIMLFITYLLVFIGAIWLIKSLIKLLFKIGRSLFGGRR